MANASIDAPTAGGGIEVENRYGLPLYLKTLTTSLLAVV